MKAAGEEIEASDWPLANEGDGAIGSRLWSGCVAFGCCQGAHVFQQGGCVIRVLVNVRT